MNLPHKKPLKAYMSEKEKGVYSLLQRLQTIKNMKVTLIYLGWKNKGWASRIFKGKEDRRWQGR